MPATEHPCHQRLRRRWLPASGDVEAFDPHFIAATRVCHDTTVKDVPAKVLTLTPREAAASRAGLTAPGGPPSQRAR